jgi:DNA-binding IclR family transcriptional regulator
MLELIADNGGEPMRLSAMAAAMDAPKSSVHSILKSLQNRRFLEQADNGGYRLGIRAFEIGAAYSRQMSLPRAVHPELVNLSHDLTVTAHFAILDGSHVLYLEKEDPPGPSVRVASAVGARLPAHLTAVGKAALAHAVEAAISQVDLSICGTSCRPSSRAMLDDELAEVRRAGYAIDDGEAAAGISCIASPVFDAKGRCCGSIGVSYLSSSALPWEAVAHRVRSAAGRASGRLGAPGQVA